MRILGLIPARGGSKGVKGKNIKLLNGKPLIQYTWESAQESKLLTRTILSSEDDDIIELSKNLGMNVPFQRPAELAQDHSKSLDVIIHALNYFKAIQENFDAVCILQPTTPFRDKGLIDKAIETFIAGDFDSLVSVRRVPDEYNPHWVFEEKDGSLHLATKEQKIINRRQELPNAYFRDGAIYLTKVEVIINELSLYGKKIGFVETSNQLYVNIDTPEDWIEAEELSKFYY